MSLTADIEGDIEVATPPVPRAEPWSNIEQLNREKELVGIYLSAHPLDDYRIEIDKFCKTTTNDLQDLEPLREKEIAMAGIVTATRDGMTKTGNPMGGFTIEDYSGSQEFMFFGKDYMKFKNYCTQGYSLFVRGRVEEKKWGKEEPKPLVINVTSVEMLGDLREKIKGITLRVAVITSYSIHYTKLYELFPLFL